jgi:hypothetical protein
MVDIITTGLLVIEVTPPIGPAAVLDPIGLPGEAGPAGNDGWTAVAGTVPDGQRVVLTIIDFAGGSGDIPPFIGKFIGATGYVDTAAEALDKRRCRRRHHHLRRRGNFDGQRRSK